MHYLFKDDMKVFSRLGSRDNCSLSNIKDHCCCKDSGDCFNTPGDYKNNEPGCPECGYWCECEEDAGRSPDFKCLCYPCNKEDYEKGIFRICRFCIENNPNRYKVFTFDDMPQSVKDAFLRGFHKK